MAQFHSGLEEKISEELTRVNIPFEYEKTEIRYTRPEKVCKYKPPFILWNGIVLEVRERLTPSDRRRLILVKRTNPELDIRIVFADPNIKLSKKGKTTCAMWAQRNGFLWATASIPHAWLEEPARRAIRLEGDNSCLSIRP
jgi:hypothetical protein